MGNTVGVRVPPSAPPPRVRICKHYAFFQSYYEELTTLFSVDVPVSFPWGIVRKSSSDELCAAYRPSRNPSPTRVRRRFPFRRRRRLRSPRRRGRYSRWLSRSRTRAPTGRFRLVCEALGLSPEEIVFVDDQLRNIDARRAQLDAIQFDVTRPGLALRKLKRSLEWTTQRFER